MKIPNKQDFQNFMNLYKKCTEKPYYFFVINATFASDNLLRLRINISKEISKLTMTIDNKNRDEKSQCDINREAAEYQYYCLEKLIDLSILQAKTYCLLIKNT